MPPRSGKRPRYTPQGEKRVLEMLDQPPPSGYAQWNGSLLAKALSLPADYVWKVLRDHGIQLQRRRSWCISTDPQFAQKAADVVGLYLDPPETALVLCVDEKPHIQALERAQGYLKLPNGRALTGFSHEYQRHGTTTLFAALETATGQVIAGHYQTRRRVELHYIPTHASWMNQVEVWFSLLSRYALQGASFTSPQELRQAIDRFVATYNPSAHPFEWTKEVVHPKGLKRCYADVGK